MKSVLLFLALAVTAFAQTDLPKPELQVTVAKDFANICLTSGQGYVFEVQRKTRGMFSKWKVIGLLPSGVPCLQDQKPPANSRYRLRGINMKGEKGPYSDAMP